MSSGSAGGGPLMLEGMTVLSFCHYLQGPAATQYLADMGANVIKIEPPKGAFERHWSGADTFVGEVSAFYLSANRNKRSIAIDLKNPAARPVVERLIAGADVMVENYKRGVMDRLGYSYAAARSINPRIIYASATGFGSRGPAKDRPGQDLLVQARSGIISTNGAGDMPIGFSAVDQHGAALLAMGIAAAYARQVKTGEGVEIESSLLNAGIDLQMESLSLYFSGRHKSEKFSRRRNLGSWFHEAPYGVYDAADGRIAISLNPMARLIAALDDETLATAAALDPHADRDEIARRLAAILVQRSLDELSACLEREGVWYAMVQSYDDLRADPQLVANEVFRDIELPDGARATLVNHPLRYDGNVPELRKMPPAAGADSADILKELGFSAGEIGELVQTGVLAMGGGTNEHG